MVLRTMSKSAVVAPVLFCLLAGCAKTPPLGQNSQVTVVSTSELPQPVRADLTTGGRAYFVGPFDKLQIEVFGIPDLKRQVVIDSSGRLYYPLAGEIQAAGKTPLEIATMIQDRLRGNYVRDPQVTVNLEEAVSNIVTVDGQVANPGMFPVIGQMTLVRAVARAGGTTEFAKLNDVVIFRTVAGRQYAGLYNLAAIRRGNYPDPEIYAQDVIIVGDSPARRLFKDVLQIAPLLSTPLIVLTNRP